GFQIAAGDERVAEQKRAHVVAVDPLVHGRVERDRVLHPEEALDTAALPYQRVERGDQPSRVDAPGHAGTRIHEGRLCPPLHLSLDQPSLLDQFGYQPFGNRFRTLATCTLPSSLSRIPVAPAIDIEVARD